MLLYTKRQKQNNHGFAINVKTRKSIASALDTSSTHSNSNYINERDDFEGRIDDYDAVFKIHLKNSRPHTVTWKHQTMNTLMAGCHGNAFENLIKEDGFRIRKLMPIECERLQGMPENWTKTGATGKEISDSQRYKCCGNAVSVPVVQHILERMMQNQ